MTNQKLYALKTSDTGEWVNHNSVRWVVSPSPKLYSSKPAIQYEVEGEIERNCEWVEVWVIEAKDVTETVLHLEVENIIQEHRIGYATEALKLLSIMDMKRGFRACLRYLGVG